MILLDTCALIWWTLDPTKLSEKATIACNSISKSGAIISSISIWEIGIKMKKGNLDLGIGLEEYVDRLKKTNGLEILPVDENIWLRNIALDWPHKDPADRTIVATAILEDVPIITKDEIIQQFYSRVIW